MNKINFSQIDKKLQIKRATIPQHVSVTKNPDDEKYEQIVERQERFLKLPEEIKNRLASHKTGEIIEKIGEFFGMELLQTASVARAVRMYYFEELKRENIVEYIVKDAEVDKEKAEKISQILNSKIFLEKNENKKEEIEEINIKEAVKKYSEIIQQVISQNKINIKSIGMPARPTVENWIKDYYEKLGRGGHGLLERGNYLFHSENGKKLNHIDRQKVGMVLKSLDEGLNLKINKKEKRIIFEKQIEDGNNKKQEYQEKKEEVVKEENVLIKQEEKKEEPKKKDLMKKSAISNTKFNFADSWASNPYIIRPLKKDKEYNKPKKIN